MPVKNLCWPIAAASLWAMAAVAAGPDPSLLQGLEVRRDALPGRTWFNGVTLEATRLTGRDVRRLVQRWLDAHGMASATPRVVAGWDIYSHLQGNHSEVLQIRSAGEGQEAIWSMLSPGHPPPAAPAARPALPMGCQSGPEVQGADPGAAFRQWTARCSGTPDQVLEQLRLAALRDGRVITQQWPRGLAMQDARGSHELLVIVVPAAQGSGLVVLERWRTRGRVW